MQQLSLVQEQKKSFRRSFKFDTPVRKAIYSRNQEERDTFEGNYKKSGLITPPYKFTNLYTIAEESDALQKNGTAVVTNVTGFGYDLNFLGDDHKEKESKEARFQELKIRNFFDEINEDECFLEVLDNIGKDIEYVGNAAIEIADNLSGEPGTCYHLPISTMRMTAREDTPYVVQVPMMREGELTNVRVKKYFRKYAQKTSKKGKMVWFKEYGDPRTMDWRDGKYKEGIKDEHKASSVIWFKLQFGNNAYGIPRWMGAVLEVLGRRLAQFINYDLFDNQGIPPILITISNGVLTQESWNDLQAFFNSCRSHENFNRVAVLESMPDTGGLEEKGNAKIEIKNMSDARADDVLFEKYLEYTEAAIRRIYRIPPIYTGGTEEFTRATALASIMVAEQNLFTPMRTFYTRIVNRLLVHRGLKCRLWEVVLRGPRVASSDEITKGVSTFTEAGALSINNAIDLANRAFGTTISKRTEPWAELPAVVMKFALQQGVQFGGLEGAQEVLDALSGVTPTQAKQVQAIQKKLKAASGPQGRLPILLDDSPFSDEDKILYYKMTALQELLEDRTFYRDVVDTDVEI